MRPEAVQATTADGVVLRGELVRGDDVWVALVHDVGEDLDAWRRLRPRLAAEGWSVLALDLRGHGGSEGEWSSERAELDVDLAVALARRLGARHVAVVGSGLGAVLALRAVERALPEEFFDLPDSLVLVSPGPLEGLDPTALRGEGVPKLVLYGARDSGAREARAIARASIGWTLEVTLPTGAHGSALLETWLPEVLDKTAAFLRERAALGGPGLARVRRRLGQSG